MRRRLIARVAAGPLLAALTAIVCSAIVAAPFAGATAVSAHTRQLILVSDPVGDTATLTAYARTAPTGSVGATWHRVAGPWPAEIGRSGVRAHRREGDGATPLGTFAIGRRLYGNAPRPAGLHDAYVRLRCGDWWDEDPASPRYNRFVALPCGARPGFGGDSEALWTETTAYPYFAVIDFNLDPIRHGGGSDPAPGSGIFLHSWVGAGTDGCVAVHRGELLQLLRWLKPSAHPMIEITRAPDAAAIGASGSVLARTRPGERGR